jgi:hypothetical protein
MILVLNTPGRPRPLQAMVALYRCSVVKRLGAVWAGLMVGLLFASGAQAHRWVQAVNGQVPSGAVGTGIERGANLYVCRVTHDGSKHPGKLIVNDGCHIGYGGGELNLKSYEVLVGSVNWVASSKGQAVPAGAVIGGVERGINLYVCRSTMPAGSVHGGKLMGTDTCNVGYGGQEYPQTSFEVAVTGTAPVIRLAPVAVDKAAADKAAADRQAAAKAAADAPAATARARAFAATGAAEEKAQVDMMIAFKAAQKAAADKASAAKN